MKIALDIGHAEGTGARGNGLEEHAVATRITAALAAMLTRQGHEVTIIDYPDRGNDRDLEATVAAINAGNFDLSVSIHCDSSDSPSACGAHVCYNRTYNKDGGYADSVQGKRLASCIADRISKLLPGRADMIQARPDKSTKPAKSSLYVLRGTIPPAVLVECGFISNVSDASMMRDHPERIAEAIAQGINAYC